MAVIKIKKLSHEARVPSYAHPGDAGFDLFASADTVLPQSVPVQVSTGISLEIPKGFVGLIWDKSGLSHKYGLKTLGGVVDSGYRGEILVGIINLGPRKVTIKKGEKIAQMLIQKVKTVTFSKTKKNLSKTKRGGAGFGSTGKR
jgi:dUTP pyrophosphatase